MLQKQGSRLLVSLLTLALFWALYGSESAHVALLDKGATLETRGSAPGFEQALPSCRIEDVLDDPLTREFGQNNIRLSRTYEGTGSRVRRALQRAIDGKALRIAFVGGSVSAGHNLHIGGSPDPATWFPTRIGNWFNATFPGVQHALELAAVIPATTAYYFSFCAAQHIPQEVDFIFVELDVNSLVPSTRSLTGTEVMLRNFLNWPSRPAVIYLSAFAVSFDDMTHGWRHSALITQWLDIPMINARNIALPEIMSNTSALTKYFYGAQKRVDKRHMNTIAHSMLADLTIGYLREQLCLLQRNAPYEAGAKGDWPANGLTDDPPRLRMLDRYDETTIVPDPQPQCHAVGSPQYPLQPLVKNGWTLVNHNDKKSFEATEAGAEISFRIEVTEGIVGLFLWKTAVPNTFGQLRCFLDENDEVDAVVKSYDPIFRAAVFEHSGNMFEGVDAGTHLLRCQVEEAADGGTTVRIFSVVTR